MLNASSSAELVIIKTEPDVSLEKINDLGINTLLAKGTSDYGKSPASRINNIRVGMAKFNGIIVAPGEEFSFNNILGGVEEKDGYQAELVIKNGALVKEFGGGLCQVSTTVFRAAILAGFPITERKPHSFPVQYYNPQGYDSTIYPGVVDLKFINDTKNHILIQTKVSGSRLSVEIYGSGDGRKVALEGPVQYDMKPSGAMKAYFIRRIYNGEQLAKEERFDSVYKAPPVHPLERNPLE
jgi:vancomycin resistance protein YoaR